MYVCRCLDYTKVKKVRATPLELGTQLWFDQEALADLETIAPKYVVNLGAEFEWDRFSLGVHEIVYGESSDYDNDGGATNGTVMYYKYEVGVTPITNLEVSFKATEGLMLTLGATNVFDAMPEKRNATHREIQFEDGDNSAVAACPAFAPFGVNGAYYYGVVVYGF